MKVFVLCLIWLAVAAGQGCRAIYSRQLHYLQESYNLQLGRLNGLYSSCVGIDTSMGFQPTCSFDKQATQAVAKINRQGTFTTKSGQKISYHLRGVISFQTLDPQRTKIYGVFTGVLPFYPDSNQFSLHVHQKGETNPSCSATGDHYNPCGKGHSDDSNAENRHIGDVAKVTLIPGSDAIVIETIDTQVKLSGPLSVLGRSVTVHAGQSAARVGCATIGVTEWMFGDTHPDTVISPSSEFWAN